MTRRAHVCGFGKGLEERRLQQMGHNVSIGSAGRISLGLLLFASRRMQMETGASRGASQVCSSHAISDEDIKVGN